MQALAGRVNRSCRPRVSVLWTPGLPRVPSHTRHHATAVFSTPSVGPEHKVHGFVVRRKKDVPELQLTATQLEHVKTGAEYLHIARDDTNNVFSIGFKTNPPDKTGVPHILEHTTLCGSQRYPVRDPFFKMLRRSLSNFMNAFTSADHTSYPFATTNHQDFRNLMSVYLDATLHPLLKKEDFMQEGWRIGPESVTKPSGDLETSGGDDRLVFKGVVYNEMKGQMSDVGYLYYIKFQEHIFPAINNSGGDPQKMTDLTYDDLKTFHAKNYHPSNAKLLTYGNIPLEAHARKMNEYLQNFTKVDLTATNKKPIDLGQGSLDYTVDGPADPLLDSSQQHKTSVAWIMNDTSDVFETFGLSILSSLLLEGYGSPFHQGLIEKGLGTDFSPNTGYDASGQTGLLAIGLNGVRADHINLVHQTIDQILRSTCAQGIDQQKIEGLLHQLELGLKHKTANFGMGLMQRVQPGWFNGVDPFNALAWNDTVNAFRKNVAEGRYLEGLMEKYLLTRPTMKFTMQPSSTYAQDMEAEEKSRLSSKLSTLSDSAASITAVHNDLKLQETKLLEAQSKAPDEDLSCLPTLHVQDINRSKQQEQIRQHPLGPVQVQWREADTNGLTYFRAINILSDLPNELRELIPLFSDAIMRLGTKDKSMEEIEDLIKLKTGGISLSYHSSPSPSDHLQSKEGLALSGYALDRNIGVMFDLFRAIIHDTDFDGPGAEENIRQLLQADASGAVDSIAGSGHSYARRFAEAGLTSHGWHNEQTAGLTQVQYIANAANRPREAGLTNIIEKLKAIQTVALSSSSQLRVAITCGEESVHDNEEALSRFLSSLPVVGVSSTVKQNLTGPAGTHRRSYFDLPYQVAYSAMALPTVSYLHEDTAALQITSQLLTHKYLHHEIREKGGAYGGGAYSRGLSGLFGYYSYRDPNPQNTLAIYEGAGAWARDKQWTSQDLEEAKLSTFQGIDAPQAVSDEGMTRFLTGIDEGMEQIMRERLLDCNKEDVRQVAERYLVAGLSDARITVLGERKSWVKETEGWDVRSINVQNMEEMIGASDLGVGGLDHR